MYLFKFLTLLSLHNRMCVFCFTIFHIYNFQNVSIAPALDFCACFFFHYARLLGFPYVVKQHLLGFRIDAYMSCLLVCYPMLAAAHLQCTARKVLDQGHCLVVLLLSLGMTGTGLIHAPCKTVDGSGRTGGFDSRCQVRLQIVCAAALCAKPCQMPEIYSGRLPGKTFYFPVPGLCGVLPSVIGPQWNAST